MGTSTAQPRAPTEASIQLMPSVLATLRLERTRAVIAAVAILAAFAAPSGARIRLPYSETGLASWYGDSFHGRQTASGETFDASAITVAHPSLPFGTRVQITHLRNKRTAVAIVNDRGPYVENRIVDCSEALARALGFARRGIARVRLDVLSLPGTETELSPDARACIASPVRGRATPPARTPRVVAARTGTAARYCVQIGAFRQASNAQEVIRRANVLPLPTFHRDTPSMRLAFAGPFESRDLAFAALRDLEASGIRGFVRLQSP